MIEKLKDLPHGIDGIRTIGKISMEDYEQVFVPLLDQARREGRRVRFLYQFGTEFEGFTAGAAWEDAKIGLQSMRLFDGCAVVTDLIWMREFMLMAGFLMPYPVRVFSNEDYTEAIGWLRSLPEGAAVSHRLLPEFGVIVVEIKHAPRARNFDALALTADTWIEAHGELRGLVIHACEFPGWEDLGSVLHHVRFIRDHHLEVKRVALATDSTLSALAPAILKHFTHAEVKIFDYDEVNTATAWAAEPATHNAAVQTTPH